MTQDFQPKTGFALFGNKHKTDDKHPDRRGQITLTGEVLSYIRDNAHKGVVELDLSGWDKQSKNGDDYIRGSINVQRPKDGQNKQTNSRPKARYEADF